MNTLNMPFEGKSCQPGSATCSCSKTQFESGDLMTFLRVMKQQRSSYPVWTLCWLGVSIEWICQIEHLLQHFPSCSTPESWAPVWRLVSTLIPTFEHLLSQFLSYSILRVLSPVWRLFYTCTKVVCNLLCRHMIAHIRAIFQANNNEPVTSSIWFSKSIILHFPCDKEPSLFHNTKWKTVKKRQKSCLR